MSSEFAFTKAENGYFETGFQYEPEPLSLCFLYKHRGYRYIRKSIVGRNI